ncbi:unnamed protein product [Lactuca virosa]|uniref:Uncharacterized protein n=1 Tax=Lactuca virosa TaxID=75947 RepID=A0AAU9NLQ2_9ASTR|nr:unnamed protein product [Lactuca virosa]
MAAVGTTEKGLVRSSLTATEANDVAGNDSRAVRRWSYLHGNGLHDRFVELLHRSGNWESEQRETVGLCVFRQGLRFHFSGDLLLQTDHDLKFCYICDRKETRGSGKRFIDRNKKNEKTSTGILVT